jgi:hypothetical protein
MGNHLCKNGSLINHSFHRGEEIFVEKGSQMKKKIGFRVWTYFVCVSFLLMMNGFPKILAEAKEGSIPIGEMISKGGVKFEARENVWKEVESSHFPIFQGQRIKTEKGAAIITHSNNSQIEVGSNSLFSFDQNDRFVLSQGNIEFRLPSSSEMDFRIGNLSILRSRSLQATKNSSVTSAKDEEAMGSISIHPNGSATIKSIQGKLSVLDQDHVVLASLSSEESITIPSVTMGEHPGVMVAQASGPVSAGGETARLSSLSTGEWVGLGLIGLGFSGIVTLGVTTRKHEGGPICP